jgi:hypothetical protein
MAEHDEPPKARAGPGELALAAATTDPVGDCEPAALDPDPDTVPVEDKDP